MINLGSKVRDTLTGLTGIAYGRTDYMYGCARVTIEPTELKDGKPMDTMTFDEQRVEETAPAKPFIYPATTFKLGSKVKDKVSGFSGVATGRHVDMYGTSSILIEPEKLHEGKTIDAHFFNESRVELVVEQAPKVSPQSSARSGGPQPSARMR